jgi:hypothetical protein
MDIRLRKRLAKKAVLFSLMSVLFSILFITIFSHNFTTSYEDELSGSNVRIKVMDVYTKNLETYIGESIKISTYRSLDAITRYRDEQNLGFFSNFSSFNKTFSNCMICGYTDCTNSTTKNATNNCSIEQYDIISRLDNIKALSLLELNIKMDYEIHSIEISQEYPFEVQVTINVSYNVTDNSGKTNYAQWNKNRVISQYVSIIGLLDPQGYINDPTNTYNRTIKRYTGICEFNEQCWNLTNTDQFYSEDSFRQYKGGISFLHRYWNDNNSSECCGIETILHPSELSPPDLNNSYIDNYYWDRIYTCGNGTKIVNISLNSDDIHLDVSTAARYKLSATNYCPS